MLNDEFSPEVSNQVSFINKKHKRTILSLEDRTKLERDKELSVSSNKTKEVNEEKAALFKANFDSFQFDYNDISLFERELNYQSLNTYDILIIFDNYTIDDKNHFQHLIGSIINSTKEKAPFFAIRLSIIGKIITLNGQINLTLHFIEMNEENAFNEKLNSIFNSFMIEDEMSLNELIHETLSMHWMSNAKCIFLLHNAIEEGGGNGIDKDKDYLILSQIDNDIIEIARKGIDFYGLLIGSNQTIAKLFEQFKLRFIKSNQLSHSCVIEQIDSNKEDQLTERVAKKSGYLMRHSLYRREYVNELLLNLKLDTLNYITAKYNVNDDNVPLLDKIDLSKLTANDKKRIDLITNKLSIMAIDEKVIEKMPSVEDEHTLKDEETFTNNELLDVRGDKESQDKGKDNNLENKTNKEEIIVSNFSNRNVINTKSIVFLYDVSFSSIHNCIRHSTKCSPPLYYPRQKINCLNPNIKHSQTEAVIKLSENIYLANHIYSIAAYDYLFDSKFKATVPIETKQSNYHLDFFLQQIKYHALIEEIGLKFNLHYYKLYPHSGSPIKFIKHFIYEMEHYNSKYIIANQIPGRASGYNTELDLDIKEAFSHFSYQITEGQCLIDEIQDINEVIINQRLNLINATDGYQEIIHFFLLHSCNEICRKMQLKHPKDINNDSIDSSFYELSEISTNGPFICYLCNKIHNNQEEVYCADCIDKNNKSIRKANCKKCHSLFEYSTYYYNQLNINQPSQCLECINEIDDDNN